MLSTPATHAATFPRVSRSVLLGVAAVAMTASSTMSDAADTAPLVMETRIALVYDALYTWCRTLQGERHGWYPAQVQQDMLLSQ